MSLMQRAALVWGGKLALVMDLVMHLVVEQALVLLVLPLVLVPPCGLPKMHAQLLLWW
jgi:hypothetical protein